MSDTTRHLAIVLRRATPWILALGAAAFLLYRTALRPVPVQTHTVQHAPLVAEVSGTGTLEARLNTTISPRLQERLAEVLVDQGDAVRAGQLLARLDDGELRRQLEVAEATLAAAQATAHRIRIDETRAEAVEHQARLDHARVADLVAKQVSSASDLDKAVEQLGVAESDLQRARAATAEAQQQIVTAQRNLAYHQERLGFAHMTSPYDGLIVRRDQDPGGVVLPGSSILHLISTNQLWISAWIDETASTNLAPGQPARVWFRSEPGHARPGRIARLGRETDRETREFLVDVLVDQLPPNWTLGQRADVTLETGRLPQALLLPWAFLQWRDAQPGAFVLAHGRAHWRPLSLGTRGQQGVDVLHGLSPGDRVLAPARPQHPPLQHGQRVALP